MTLKQFYLSMIRNAILEEDERAIKYYEKELEELLKKEFNDKVKEVKASK